MACNILLLHTKPGLTRVLADLTVCSNPFIVADCQGLCIRLTRSYNSTNSQLQTAMFLLCVVHGEKHFNLCWFEDGFAGGRVGGGA